MKGFSRTPTASANDFFPITPDDSNDLPFVSLAIYVGTAGDVVVTSMHGNTSTFKNVQAGTVLDVRATRVWATGTTASDLVNMVTR